jgi:replicative DNA helicase
MVRSPTHNSTYPRGWVSCSKDSFVVNEALAFQIKFCGKSHTLRLAAKRFEELDEVTEGFKKGKLTIIGGRPGMGKTAFAISLARNAAFKYGKTVAYWSLELSVDQLLKRFILQENAGFNSGDENLSCNLRLLESSIFMMDKIFDISELAKSIADLKNTSKVDLVIIDYFQLLSSLKNPKIEGDTLEKLKKLAVNFDVSVILLSQLSREVDIRFDNHRPQITDLYGIDGLNDNIDAVLFIYRPDYYERPNSHLNKLTTPLLELIIVKHDSILQEKTINLQFDKVTTRVY